MYKIKYGLIAKSRFERLSVNLEHGLNIPVMLNVKK